MGLKTLVPSLKGNIKLGGTQITVAPQHKMQPQKRKRRKTGEMSGQQLRLKKFDTEGSNFILWEALSTATITPPFKATVMKMRQALDFFLTMVKMRILHKMLPSQCVFALQKNWAYRNLR